MRILLISLYFHPAVRYGGPVASTWGLARGLAQAGARVRVLTTDADGPRRLVVPRGWHELEPGLEVCYCRRAGGELLSPGLAARLPGEIRRADVVHVSGLLVWALPLVLPLARALGKKLVVSPRGMMMPVALVLDEQKKQRFLAVVDRLGFARVTFHATAEDEAEVVRRRYPGARVVVIPNGIEVPAASERPAERPEERPYLLYLGRLHPYKQIEGILDAFARAELPAAACLVLAGDGEPDYRRALEAHAAGLGLSERARFVGGVEGPTKAAWLAHAAGVVLASRSENFGVAVAEGLAHGTPAVVTHTAPWQGLETHQCGFWVPPDPTALAAGFTRLLALPPEERAVMGERGRAWMAREFSWQGVTAAMLREYEVLLGAR